MTRSELIHAIVQAFDSAPPSPGALIAPGADDGDARELRRRLRGRRWMAVPRTAASEDPSGLSWFTPAALRHYLPLWLLASLDHGMVRMWTVTQLRFAAERPQDRPRFALLTAPERAVVASFLRWIEEHHEDERESARTALTWWSA